MTHILVRAELDFGCGEKFQGRAGGWAPSRMQWNQWVVVIRESLAAATTSAPRTTALTPLRGSLISHFHPWLTPWALFLRRFVASSIADKRAPVRTQNLKGRRTASRNSSAARDHSPSGYVVKPNCLANLFHRLILAEPSEAIGRIGAVQPPHEEQSCEHELVGAV
jgi:hypothetical protein